jgi:hypothetical protein
MHILMTKKLSKNRFSVACFEKAVYSVSVTLPDVMSDEANSITLKFLNVCTPVLSHNRMVLNDPTANTSPSGHQAIDVIG